MTLLCKNDDAEDKIIESQILINMELPRDYIKYNIRSSKILGRAGDETEIITILDCLLMKSDWRSW